MENARSSPVLGSALSTIYRLGAVGTLTDGQLLEWFLARNDPAASEAAFSVLVERHGAMVLGICQKMLGDPHDAHDAFQATFLVLVSKARSIRRREAVGGWLFGIARRVAARRRSRPRGAAVTSRLCSMTSRPPATNSSSDQPLPPRPITDISSTRSTGFPNSYARRSSCTTSMGCVPRPSPSVSAARVARCSRGYREHAAGSRKGWSVGTFRSHRYSPSAMR